MFQGLDVVGILRVGLSGFCFLLSLLSFWLIRQEQQRPVDPRGGILKVIYTYMAANLASAILVAGLGYSKTANAAEPLSAKTYLVKNTSYIVDLTGWKPIGGPVVVTRMDDVEKVSDTRDDFVIPAYTNGAGIEWKKVAASSEPSFTESNAPDHPGKHAYEYRVAMGREPKEHKESIISQFTFLTGFPDPKNEWWKAYAPYPTKSMTIVIHFPADKRCRGIDIYSQPGSKTEKRIEDNPAVISNNGLVAMWTGLEIPAETRIGFKWQWDSAP